MENNFNRNIFKNAPTVKDAVKICMLLNGEILNDARVIKTITSLSNHHLVDLFYISDNPEFFEHLFNNNVRLFAFPAPKGILANIIRHSFFYNEFLFFVDKVIEQNIKYNYIFVNDLPCLKPAIILKKRLNSTVIYDSHEIYCETINQFFPINAKFPKNIFFRLIIQFMRFLGERAEKKLLNHVDVFLTVGEGLKEYFEKKYRYKDIKVVMNCPQISSHQCIEKINYSAMLNLDKKAFVVLYQGVLNEGRGLKPLISAMQFTNKSVVLVIIGYGMLEQTLKKEVENLSLKDKVFFLGKIPVDQLSTYTAGANCGINLLEPLNKSKELAVPNKLFQYIHASIPVIASNSYENHKLFEKYNIGYLVENTPQSIAEAINRMSSVDRTYFVVNCQKAALEYNWENQEKILLKLIQ